MLVTDGAGVVTRCNREAEHLFGLAAEEAIGRDAREVVAGRIDPAVVDSAVAEATQGRAWQAITVVTRPDGSRRDCRIVLTPIIGSEGTPLGMVGVAVDITEWGHRQRTLAIEHAVTAILAESQSLASAIRRVLKAICQELSWDWGAMWAIDDKTGVLRLAHHWSASDLDLEEFAAVTAETAFNTGEGLPGRIWESAGPDWIPDVVADTNFPRAEAARRAGLHGGFGFPILLGEEVLGIFEFFSREPQEPNAELLSSMAVIGSQIGQVIERRQAELELRTSEAFQSAILDASLDALVSIDHTGRIIDFNRAAETMFGYRREEVTGQPMHQVIIPPELRPQHQSSFRRHLETGESRILNRRVELTGLRRDGSRFPVELTITRVQHGPNPTFTGFIRDITERKSADEAVTNLLAAEQAARAQAEEAQGRLAFLAEASRVLAESLDYRATLERIAELATGRLSDYCIVYLAEEGGIIERIAVRGPDRDGDRFARQVTERYAIDPRGGGVAEVIRTGRPALHPEADAALLAADVDDPAGMAKQLEGVGITSWMCVPLALRGRIFGAISLVSTGRTYSEADLSLAEELASRAAQSIENARLYQQGLSVASTLQAGLLPPRLPSIPGIEIAAVYEPAGRGTEVGGDFYDVFSVEDDRWAIVIGDVCGKGIAAASFTGLVRHAIRAIASREDRPSSVLRRVNEVIVREESDQFCTLIYAEYRPSAAPGRIGFSVAGHPLPLLIGGDGSVAPVGAFGTPIGIFPDPDLDDHQVDLNGDLLVLYTDGLVDESQGGGGEEHLSELLKRCARQEVTCVIQAVRGPQVSNRDDRAVLAVGRR